MGGGQRTVVRGAMATETLVAIQTSASPPSRRPKRSRRAPPTAGRRKISAAAAHNWAPGTPSQWSHPPHRGHRGCHGGGGGRSHTRPRHNRPTGRFRRVGDSRPRARPPRPISGTPSNKRALRVAAPYPQPFLTSAATTTGKRWPAKTLSRPTAAGQRAQRPPSLDSVRADGPPEGAARLRVWGGGSRRGHGRSDGYKGGGRVACRRLSRRLLPARLRATAVRAGAAPRPTPCATVGSSRLRTRSKLHFGFVYLA